MKFFDWFLILIFIGILIFLALGRRGHMAANIGSIKYAAIGNTKISVELALTNEAKAKGLSGRETLSEDSGMLFVFDYPLIHPFWMKDMNFPIDMIWIDENGIIVYIERNAKPESFPNVFGSNVESKYVLEVVSGFSDKHQLKIGDRVTFLDSN